MKFLTKDITVAKRLICAKIMQHVISTLFSMFLETGEHSNKFSLASYQKYQQVILAGQILAFEAHLFTLIYSNSFFNDSLSSSYFG